MRVLAGACAEAVGAAARPAPNPIAATPPLRKFRRAGSAGVAGSAQQAQLRRNFRVCDIGLIRSSRRVAFYAVVGLTSYPNSSKAFVVPAEPLKRREPDPYRRQWLWIRGSRAMARAPERQGLTA